MLKPHPWWLFWLPSWFWITISPNIYHPRAIDPQAFPEIIAHEQTHLRQQAQGRNQWLLHYVFRRSFRLAMEAEAYAVQLGVMRERYAPEAANDALTYAAAALAGWPYLWAAQDQAMAKEAIESALAQITR